MAFTNNNGIPLAAMVDFVPPASLQLPQVMRQPERCKACAAYMNAYCKVGVPQGPGGSTDGEGTAWDLHNVLSRGQVGSTGGDTCTAALPSPIPFKRFSRGSNRSRRSCRQHRPGMRIADACNYPPLWVISCSVMHSVYHDLKHGKSDLLFYRAVVLVHLELGAAIDRRALLLPLSLLQTNLSKGIWKCSFCGQANMQSDYLAQAQGVRGVEMVMEAGAGLGSGNTACFQTA